MCDLGQQLPSASGYIILKKMVLGISADLLKSGHCGCLGIFCIDLKAKHIDFCTSNAYKISENR
jgi:hypothetical protein